MADVNFIFINVFVQLQNQLITQYIQEEEWLISDIMTMIPTSLQKHRNSKIRIQRYVEDIISSYSLTDFQRHFRLSKYCFEIVLNELGNVIDQHCYLWISRVPDQSYLLLQFRHFCCYVTENCSQVRRTAFPYH